MVSGLSNSFHNKLSLWGLLSCVFIVVLIYLAVPHSRKPAFCFSYAIFVRRQLLAIWQSYRAWLQNVRHHSGPARRGPPQLTSFLVCSSSNLWPPAGAASCIALTPMKLLKIGRSLLIRSLPVDQLEVGRPFLPFLPLLELVGALSFVHHGFYAS